MIYKRYPHRVVTCVPLKALRAGAASYKSIQRGFGDHQAQLVNPTPLRSLGLGYEACWLTVHIVC